MTTNKIAIIGITQLCILLYKQACVYDTHTCPIRYNRKLAFLFFFKIVEIKNALNSLSVWQTPYKTEICLSWKDLQVPSDT